MTVVLARAMALFSLLSVVIIEETEDMMLLKNPVNQWAPIHWGAFRILCC